MRSFVFLNHFQNLLFCFDYCFQIRFMSCYHFDPFEFWLILTHYSETFWIDQKQLSVFDNNVVGLNV